MENLGLNLNLLSLKNKLQLRLSLRTRNLNWSNKFIKVSFSNHLQFREQQHQMLRLVFLISLMASNYIYANSILLPSSSKAGDLIFRRGTEAVSAAVLAADNGEFSHVGMLVGDPSNWKVIHATPAEKPHNKDGVIIDDLDFFLSPALSQKFAVYQVQATQQQRLQAIEYIQKQQHKSFSLKDDEQGTYCTALVWRAYFEANLNLEVKFTYLNIPLMRKEYLLLTPLTKSRYLQRLN